MIWLNLSGASCDVWALFRQSTAYCTTDFCPCSRGTIATSLAPNLLFFTSSLKDRHEGHIGLHSLKIIYQVAEFRFRPNFSGYNLIFPSTSKRTSEKGVSGNRLNFSIGGYPLIATLSFLSHLGACKVSRQDLNSCKYVKKRHSHGLKGNRLLWEADTKQRPTLWRNA